MNAGSYHLPDYSFWQARERDYTSDIKMNKQNAFVLNRARVLTVP
jgi:hypothetical protein